MVQSELVAGDALMTADEARATEFEIIKTGDHLRRLLLTFHDQQGYTALGYSSYTAWANAIAPRLFGIKRSRLAQELTAALIERELSTMVDNSPIPERQLRPMSALIEQPRGPGAATKSIIVNGDAIRETWQAAQQIAAGREERFSARHVTEAVNEYREEAMNARPAARFNAAMRSSDSPEWNTPARILDPARALLGTIDLDPCSNETAQRAVKAQRYYTEADDGLTQAWHARALWMNPPYGTTIGRWVQKLVSEYAAGNIDQALALVPARTETDWFVPLFRFPICFVHGRLQFSGYETSAPFPSVVVYLGTDAARFAQIFDSIGYLMYPHGAAEVIPMAR